MKCTNKKKAIIGLCLMLAFTGTGCGATTTPISYNMNSEVSAFRIIHNTEDKKIDAFASALCVGNEDVTENTDVDMSQATAAGLFDINNHNIIYAKNIHKRLYPASLTKILTAIVALEHGNPNSILTVTDDVLITESGAQLCGLEPGDTLTLNQALHALLIYSANDAANAIAVHIGGSQEGFVEMMNDTAASLGATGSHFVNAHGLADDNHYTTAYDLYLLFEKAIKYELFREIIHMNSYETVYQDSLGNDKEMSFTATNLYLKGTYKAPDKVTVIGGKTGTTNQARNCLIMLSKDTAGNPYISVILSSAKRQIMYEQMTDLLEEIYN